ncbi:MAG: radical SAM protein [Gemmataceae bacterium]|nr:radical SAM protein [Gemmataceae bacterium]
MYLRLLRRLLVETDKRLLWKLAWNLGFKGIWSVERFKRRLKYGEVFPPFLYVSIINSCNLRCQGCWVDVAAKMEAMPPHVFHRLVREAQDMGNSFFGIVGGEPFMHPQLFDLLEPHSGCYFQVFTNGHFITADTAKKLRRLGNITPLISVEGSEVVSDQRRGKRGVLSRTMQGLHHCLNHKVLTGVCTSVCQTNLDLVNEKWLDRLIDLGVMYTWFHVYRPMGPDASPHLCLTPEQQLALRQFVVEMRAKKPIIIIDAYYDGEGRALCPAATGISHHINPWGDIEPCPIVQFSRESIRRDKDDRHLRTKFRQSAFLRDFRSLARSTTRGCIVLERPDLLGNLIDRHAAPDTTVRGTARQELSAMTTRTSQFHPTRPIPEKNLLYRLAKRLWFNDFGAYTGFDHSRTAAPALLAGAAPRAGENG